MLNCSNGYLVLRKNCSFRVLSNCSISTIINKPTLTTLMWQLFLWVFYSQTFKCPQLQTTAPDSLTPPGSSGARVQTWGSGLNHSNLGTIPFWITPGTELFLWHLGTIHLAAGMLGVGADSGMGCHGWLERKSLPQCPSRAQPRAALLHTCPLPALGSAPFSQPGVCGEVFAPWCSMSSVFSVTAAGSPRWERCATAL